jgi:hypothetical protein
VTSYTVTGSTTNNGFGGCFLKVYVLTGAATPSSPANASSSAAYNVSITTTTTGSYVVGGINNNTATGTFTASAGTTITDDYSNTTVGNEYASFHTTSATGTPGATTVGSSTAFAGTYGVLAVEIKASGTIAFDASAPAVATSNTLTSLTTASFTPPAGSLLVAVFTTDGGSASQQVGSMSSAPALTWTEQANLSTGFGTGAGAYIGVWTAQVSGVVPFASRPYAIQAKRLPGPVAGGVTDPLPGSPAIPGPVHGGGYGSAQGSGGGPVLNPPPAYVANWVQRVAIVPFRAGR